MTASAVLACRDPIFGRISRAVPRSVDPVMRDDILSSMYLAIRLGILTPADIEAMAGRFISAAFAAWSNRWGTMSLDARINDIEGAPTFAELVEDEQALGAFDRITFRHEEALH